MEFVLRRSAPDAEIINLVSDAPTGQPRPSAYLLAALSDFFPGGSVFLCVVDPSVGGDRLPVVMKADGKWFVGPENGLLNTAAVRAERVEWWRITLNPANLSATFHGRDIFAPVVANIAAKNDLDCLEPYPGPDLSGWPANLYETIYIDHYGNAATGVRYDTRLEGKMLAINDQSVAQAKTFCSVPEGHAFWYRNSSGLVEIAVNGRRADENLGLRIGDGFGFA